MKTRRLATHGMTYGDLAVESCTIVGGVYMTLAMAIAIVSTYVGASITGWTVAGIPLAIAIAASVVVWRLGFGDLSLPTSEVAIPIMLLIAATVALFVPMILGVLLIPIDGVPLLWEIFGLPWATAALLAVLGAERDARESSPTSVSLDIAAIAIVALTIACAGIVLALGLGELLYGIVLLGGVLGVAVGIGFYTAEEIVEPETEPVHELALARAHHRSARRIRESG